MKDNVTYLKRYKSKYMKNRQKMKWDYLLKLVFLIAGFLILAVYLGYSAFTGFAVSHAQRIIKDRYKVVNGYVTEVYRNTDKYYITQHDGHDYNYKDNTYQYFYQYDIGGIVYSGNSISGSKIDRGSTLKVYVKPDDSSVSFPEYDIAPALTLTKSVFSVAGSVIFLLLAVLVFAVRNKEFEIKNPIILKLLNGNKKDI